jgi:hypothetical protein
VGNRSGPWKVPDRERRALLEIDSLALGPDAATRAVIDDATTAAR